MKKIFLLFILTFSLSCFANLRPSIFLNDGRVFTINEIQRIEIQNERITFFETINFEGISDSEIQKITSKDKLFIQIAREGDFSGN